MATIVMGLLMLAIRITLAGLQSTKFSTSDTPYPALIIQKIRSQTNVFTGKTTVVVVVQCLQCKQLNMKDDQNQNHMPTSMVIR